MTTSDSPPLQFFSEEFAANPFPLLKQLRTIGPIVPYPENPSGRIGQEKQQNQNSWLVTRLDEIVQIFKDKRFTVDFTKILPPELLDSTGQSLFDSSMVTVDDPAHKRLRSLVSKAFTPKYIESLRPHIQMIADELLTKIETNGLNGRMDLVRDYAYPLPINVISDMLGVPHDNRDTLRHLSEELVASFQAGPTEQRQAGQKFAAYIFELITTKRQHPQDDLISQLIQLEEDGDHLNETELLSMINLLIFAGHETTSNLISIGTLTLFNHPEQFARLKADFSLIPAAIEELLRFNGPVLTPTPRFATEDMEFGGQFIQRGDVMFIVLSSANRDELQFANPDELDIARTLNQHIAFGHGIHVCLGAPLARLEAEIAFITLFKRLPDLQLDPAAGPSKWRGGLGLRGLTSLPVTF